MNFLFTCKTLVNVAFYTYFRGFLRIFSPKSACKIIDKSKITRKAEKFQQKNACKIIIKTKVTRKARIFPHIFRGKHG